MTAHLSFRMRWYVICHPCVLELAFGTIHAATKRRDEHNATHHNPQDHAEKW